MRVEEIRRREGCEGLVERKDNDRDTEAARIVRGLPCPADQEPMAPVSAVERTESYE